MISNARSPSYFYILGTFVPYVEKNKKSNMNGHSGKGGLNSFIELKDRRNRIKRWLVTFLRANYN